MWTALRYIPALIVSTAGWSSLMALAEAISFLGQPGARGLEVGFGRLASFLVPEVYLSALIPAADSFHAFSGTGEWREFLAAAVVANGVVGSLAALAVAVPLLLARARAKGWSWKAAGADAGKLALFPTAFSLVDRTIAGGSVLPGLMALGLLGAFLLIRAGGGKRLTGLTRAAVVAGVAMGLLAMATGVAWLPSGEPPPNVLLVSIDTLRADHLHSYGYDRETSPNLDALAAEGARFSQAISPTSWTLPSHITLFTGIPPRHHGVNRDGTKLEPSALTLAEILAGAGYRTAAFVSGIYLSARYGFAQGFESYDRSAAGKGNWGAQVTSPALERLARGWLGEWVRKKERKPFFLFLHMWDVHFDFIPPSPYDRMFDPDYDGPVDGRNFVRGEMYHKDMDPRDFAHLLALYDGEIRFTDYHLGRIFDHLKKIGEWDNTIVVVTADHGEEFFEHRRKGHRMTLYDEVLRVPLIVRYPPSVPASVVVDSQVRLMDVAPTILSLAGVDQPASFGMQRQGAGYRPFDLSAWIEQRPNLPRIPAFGDLHGNLTSLRTEQVKLVYGFNRDFSRYYDLIADPGEQENLARQRKDDVSALKDEIKTFVAPSQEQRLAAPAELDEKHLDRLRSLGYIK